MIPKTSSAGTYNGTIKRAFGYRTHGSISDRITESDRYTPDTLTQLHDTLL